MTKPKPSIFVVMTTFDKPHYHKMKQSFKAVRLTSAANEQRLTAQKSAAAL